MLLSSLTLWRKHILKGLASFGLAAAIILPAPLAAALAYGQGGYGQCQYGQNCPPASNSSSSSSSSSSSTSSGSGSTTTPSTTDTASGSSILLNDYDQYFTDQGKILDVTAQEVIYFNVDIPNTDVGGVITQKHSVTIQEVGDDYVILVIASTPQTVRLTVGQTGQYDVTGDGHNDIEITLNSIINKKANLTFKQLGNATKKTTKTVAVNSAPAPKKSWWPIIISGLITLLGIGLLIWLVRRRRKNQNIKF